MNQTPLHPRTRSIARRIWTVLFILLMLACYKAQDPDVWTLAAMVLLPIILWVQPAADLLGRRGTRQP